MDDPNAKATAPCTEPQQSSSPSSVETLPGGIEALDAVPAVTSELPGRYEIRREQGRGGMGRVLVAFDGHVGREIALKELLPDPGTGSRCNAVRFLREARLAGRLEHPNIVPVYEVGRSQSGSLYYTMRLVRGRTLAQVLSEARTLPERLKWLRAFSDLAHAVAFAHSRGVLHRDVKPQNVMVGEFGETVLLDWGLAKVVGERDSGGADAQPQRPAPLDADVAHTAAGNILGTPWYMPPEQADGRVADIDQRSDVWSLGAVLYELLTGQPPFDAATARAVITKVRLEEVRPPRDWDPKIPAPLAAIASKALARDKAGRYQGAAELAADVDAYMVGGRISAYTYSGWEIVGNFVARHRAVAALSLALVLLALGGTGVLVAAYRQASDQRDLAKAASLEAHRQQEQAVSRELEARLNLARALQQKAETALDGRDPLLARVFAAGALLANPATSGTAEALEFARREPEAARLRMLSSSMTYQASLQPSFVLAASSKLPQPPLALSPLPGGRVALALLDGSLAFLERDGAIRKASPLTTATALTRDLRRQRLWVPLRGGGVSELDFGTGAALDRFGEDLGSTTAVAVSPSGERILLGFEQGELVLWDLRTRQAVFRAKATERVNALAYSPDGTRLAVGSADRVVRLLDASSGAPVAALEGHELPVNAVAFSPDGRFLATASFDRTVRIWDVAERRCVSTLPDHGEQVFATEFSADGKLLVSSSSNGRIWIWDAARFSLLTTWKAHDAITFAAFDVDGTDVVSAGWDGTVRRWKRTAWDLWATPATPVERPFTVAAAPDGSWVATGAYDGRLWTWDPATRAPVRSHPAHANYIFWFAVSPAADLLASSDEDRIVRLWDTRTWKSRDVPYPSGQIAISFSPDGREAALASLPRLGEAVPVRVIDTRTLRTRLEVPGRRFASFSSDGNLLATADPDRLDTLRIYDRRAPALPRTLAGNPDTIAVGLFSRDGRWLLSGGYRGSLLRWDARRLDTPPVRMEGHRNWVMWMALSPDSHLLATGSKDGTVRIWDLDAGEPIVVLRGRGRQEGTFTDNGRTFLLSDDGRLLSYPLDLLSRVKVAPGALGEAESASGLRLKGIDVELGP